MRIPTRNILFFVLVFLFSAYFQCFMRNLTPVRLAAL